MLAFEIKQKPASRVEKKAVEFTNILTVGINIIQYRQKWAIY